MSKFPKKTMNGLPISTYVTDDKTREEFELFLEWYHNQIGKDGISWIARKNLVESYFKEKNIALYDIKRLEGAYDRSPKRELGYAITAVVFGIIIALYISLKLIN